MSLLISLSPDINDDDYVLLQKWAYQAAQWSGNPDNQPAFGDTDHTLMYKIAKSSYEEQQA